MKTDGKTRVAVLYGGRSGEHEISLRSAASVARNLDRTRYELILVAIDKKGRWMLVDPAQVNLNSETLPIPHHPLDGAPGVSGSDSSSSSKLQGVPVVLPPNPPVLSSLHQPEGRAQLVHLDSMGVSTWVDVIFPVMHGPLCEDGTVQGLFELVDVPYVGCGVLASSAGMDKDVAKRLVAHAGLPVVPSVTLRQRDWAHERESRLREIGQKLGFPVFVKPANLGSSVGVHKVKTPDRLFAAVEDAFRYDLKVLVEKAVDAREIELAVLDRSEAEGSTARSSEPLVSIPGEVASTHEFYSYEAKYLDENGAALMIPAELTGPQRERAQALARDAYRTLECEGLARVDLFLDRKTSEFYFNEVNTLPGFTSISMYPKMWEATGVAYAELLTRLVELAIERHARKTSLVRDFKA